jgi:hypothetical protein
MVPFVTLILLLLRKAGTLESRKIGLRIGSIFRSHADISRTANPGE